jgi:hypothetical protein
VSGGCIIQVWFDKDTEVRRAPFNFVETELPDFDTVCIEGNRLIGGAVLWTRKTEERGVWKITERTPIAFRGEAVLRCQLPSWRFVEEG